MADMDSDTLCLQIESAVGPLADRLIEWRRHLHRYPELRFEERQTGEYLDGLLSQIGLEPQVVGRTGRVALLKGKKPGPTLALRADMDALPLNDAKDVSYKSCNPGRCHACGHDVHMAVVLGVAHVLTQLSDQLHGQVKFIFQPAEEVPSGQESGAMRMVKEGVLSNPDVTAIFGLHCWPDLMAGQIGLQRGCTMASADSFAITVAGEAAHASAPERGRDAIVAAAQIVQAVHLISAREVSPEEVFALNIGTIHGGQSQSIVCDKVEMTGTVRAASQHVRNALLSRLDEVVRSTATAFRCEARYQITDSFPAVVNDSRLCESAGLALNEILGPNRVVEMSKVPLTAEDFSFYLEKVPGLYLKLGVASPKGSPPSFPLHNPRFDVDETALATGVRGLAMVLAAALAEGNKFG